MSWNKIAVMKITKDVDLKLNYSMELDKFSIWINQSSQALHIRYSEIEKLKFALTNLESEALISAKYGRYLDVFKRKDGKVVIRQTLSVPKPRKYEIILDVTDLETFLNVVNDVSKCIQTCKEKLEPMMLREVYNDIVTVALETNSEEELIGLNGNLTNVVTYLFPMAQGKTGDDIDGPYYSLSKVLFKQKHGLSKILPESVIRSMVDTLVKS